MDNISHFLQQSLEFTQPSTFNVQHICNCPLRTISGRNCRKNAKYEIVTAFDHTRISTCKTHLRANLIKLDFPGLARVFYRYQPLNRQLLSPITTHYYPDRLTFDTRLLFKMISINEEWSDFVLYTHSLNDGIIQPLFDRNREQLVNAEQALLNRQNEERLRLQQIQDQVKKRIVCVLKIKHKEVIQNDDCSICYEPLTIETSAVRLKTCKHIFHMNCIKSMLSHKLVNCPLCRCYMISNN
jgi:hypothetical protein|uniref:RING-type domain-containing protein n=1 Tax=viral metagenome TaxID=1070528 RepID=A0A6C0BRZ2_9ZZZZ